MIRVRPSRERGHANHGWLDTYHTFSFADYLDPAHMSFRSLRVINEDRVDPAAGFPTHSHRDMEILTYILEGALEHKDSMGNGSVIRRGDIQRMSAGTGVTHSEFNASKREPVHLLQIWILPEKAGSKPGYEEGRIDEASRKGRLHEIASRDPKPGAVKVHQDVRLYTALLEKGSRIEHPIAAGRHAWLQLASGEVEFNGSVLEAGDGAAASDESFLTLTAKKPSELLLFDLA